MGYGSGMTCWHRLSDWHEAGVWNKFHKATLCEVQSDHKVDWILGAVERTKSRAMAVGLETGPNPTDRAKPGAKHHLLADARGSPLAILLTRANVTYITGLIPLVDEVPPIIGLVGHPQKRLETKQASRADD